MCGYPFVSIRMDGEHWGQQATTTITNGTVTDTTLTAVGFGYTHSNPPEVIIELPTFQTEKVTSFDEIQGFTGIITGISLTASAVMFMGSQNKNLGDITVNSIRVKKDDTYTTMLINNQSLRIVTEGGGISLFKELRASIKGR